MGGVEGIDLSFLGLICYIGVIGAMVQILDVLIVMCTLYNALVSFFITVNCAILGGSLFMVERDYSFLNQLLLV